MIPDESAATREGPMGTLRCMAAYLRIVGVLNAEQYRDLQMEIVSTGNPHTTTGYMVQLLEKRAMKA